MKLADERCVRNEFFEAEIDPATGALRAFRDTRSRINRLGQQLVYNPGSTMRGRSVRATSTGPALGELVSEGDILGPEGAVLATFKQTLRAWVGRPLLELRIEIAPTNHRVATRGMPITRPGSPGGMSARYWCVASLGQGTRLPLRTRRRLIISKFVPPRRTP